MDDTRTDDSKEKNGHSRRLFLGAAALGAMAAGLLPAAQDDADHTPPLARGDLRQSIAYWCYQTVGWSVADAIRAATWLGCPSVELVDPEHWPLLAERGLTCAIALNGMPGAPFVKGLNNRAYHDEVIGRSKRMIDACVDSDGVCRQIIAFTGYKYRVAEDPASGEISPEEGAENCVEGLRELGAYAAPHGVTISIEMLNTRDDTHPMKGHPGYQGDDVDYVAQIVERAGLPNVKLLFDVYHVQIMNGDLIRRIRQYRDLIGHVHTAGNPGRGELHFGQEIDYPAIMRTLLDIGYEGYVGQEFIPTRDPMDGLRHAVMMCDVRRRG